MLELTLCSLFTILPDYLYRKYRYGMSWGKEITFFTMWYELRWGISACAILTVSLVTLIFFYHPSTTNATPMFRTMSILPEGSGRVQHVFVKSNEEVKAGTPIFSMFDQSQMAVIAEAEVHVKEVEAEFATAQAQLEEAKSGVEKAYNSYMRSKNEYDRNKKIEDVVSKSVVQRLADTVSIKKAELAFAEAMESEALVQIETIIPAKQTSAVKSLNSALVEEAKRTVYAHVDGRLMQFLLRPGDFVNPMIRAAGILVPSSGETSGREMVHAGFNQLSAAVIKKGTFAEITCLSKPFTIIPMRVARVQKVIASGQIRPNETLLDLQQRAQPGTYSVVLEPLYEGGLEGVVPGTKCIANAYSDHHDLINSGNIGSAEAMYLHMVDTVGFVHAIILRLQALLLPVKILVFSGH